MTYFEDAELVATQGWVEDLRKVKDAREIAAIKAAAEMGDAGFHYIIERVKPGLTERELALDLEFHLRSMGSEGAGLPAVTSTGGPPGDRGRRIPRGVHSRARSWSRVEIHEAPSLKTGFAWGRYGAGA